ncbi:urease accessory protein UreD [Massilia sp. CF038]|uniref:urease accessory protein UreD n=1 Tax=Massilia sp. CF038 TaxID=1881045 RepID=UPI00091CB27E|nr:urease accessory protein UreD [Massilia sp. CF038]SHG99885.1 urease accessory protein [Massilia sp. CF038]
MPDCTQPSPSDPAAWQASLRLRFDDDGGTTRLTRREHRGPLRVQKPLYPEGPGICHAIMIHPPGGVVGGDALDIVVTAGAATHALLTSPGAAKWYRANGRISRQQVRLTVGAGAALEWLPQETIFFNDAHMRMQHDVELAADGRYIGWEILCFGRSASGERFARGMIAQRTSIRRGGALLWWEQGRLDGAGSAMHSVLGLNGATVCATLIGVGAPATPSLLAALRAIDPALAVTQIKSLVCARLLCGDSEHARAVMTRVWQTLRPHLLGCEATVPRIWHT